MAARKAPPKAAEKAAQKATKRSGATPRATKAKAPQPPKNGHPARKKRAPKRRAGIPGPQPTPIDHDELEKLGMLLCTRKELAAWFGVSEVTMIKRLKDDDGHLLAIFERGAEKGRLSLRRTQFRLAEKNATMAIFLGKQHLDQRDLKPLENLLLSLSGHDSDKPTDIIDKMRDAMGLMIKSTFTEPPANGTD